MAYNISDIKQQDMDVGDERPKLGFGDRGNRRGMIALASTLTFSLCMALCARESLAASADDLGKSLTAIGAEKAGNADGTIPAWEGDKAKVPAGWSWGQLRYKFSPYKDEKALFSVDASNVDKYASHLTDGQITAIKTVKDYRLDVYPSHRSCAISPRMAERTKMNATEAKMEADGFSLAHAKAGGVPFPIPKTGAEVMMNARLRQYGVGYEYKKGGSVISPRPGTDNYVFYDWYLTTFFPGGRKEANNYEDDGALEFYNYFTYSNPPALAGQAIVNINYLNKEPEAYYYFPGQRRVRRLPSYVFDAPLIGFENQYMVDEQTSLWTTLDRFDYKLVGKKEIYIPSNAFKGYDFEAKKEDVFGKTFVNPEFRRYELHRVWVVDAKVKEGLRHVFPHRTYYIDEDSWSVAELTDYDANDKPWKNIESWIIPIWELDGVCGYGTFQMWDLQGGRYVVDWSSMAQGVDMRWFDTSTDTKFNAKFYTPEMLRATSDR
jgi:Protein of unknown function (DUF1329)